VVIGFFDDLGLELRAMLAARPPEEPSFTALRAALGSLIDLYEERQDRVVAAKRLAHQTPSIRARLLDKHARWENGVTEELVTRIGGDRSQEPRLLAAVALAAFSTAVVRMVHEWRSSGPPRPCRRCARRRRGRARRAPTVGSSGAPMAGPRGERLSPTAPLA
jgi:MftR C-terminal domain